MSEVERRIDELLEAVKLIHKQATGHEQYDSQNNPCAVCLALWRAR
jgi:hypothetical protein